MCNNSLTWIFVITLLMWAHLLRALSWSIIHECFSHPPLTYLSPFNNNNNNKLFLKKPSTSSHDMWMNALGTKKTVTEWNFQIEKFKRDRSLKIVISWMISSNKNFGQTFMLGKALIQRHFQKRACTRLLAPIGPSFGKRPQPRALYRTSNGLS